MGLMDKNCLEGSKSEQRNVVLHRQEKSIQSYSEERVEEEVDYCDDEDDFQRESQEIQFLDNLEVGDYQDDDEPEEEVDLEDL